jgi:hypothetical protein
VYNLGKKRYNTLQEGIGLNGIGGRLWSKANGNSFQ